MTKVFSRFSHIIVASFIVSMMTLNATAADVFHEKINDVQIVTQAKLLKNTISGVYDLTLLIGDEPIEFTVKYNESLLGSRALYSSDITFYKGQIIGKSDSWARFTSVNGTITGAFYDGTELLLLEDSEALSDTLSADAMGDAHSSIQDAGQRTTVLVKATDLIHNGSCGLHDHSAVEAFGYVEYIAELQELTQAVASSEIEINLIADTEFVAGTADATADMISHLNVADGIFAEQLGIQFSLFDTTELSDNGTLSTSDAVDLVFALRASDFENPGLRHLFTGKNLDGSTVGIAFVGSLCRDSSVGVTQRLGASTAIIFAHELGHNFGSPHDSETGSACASIGGGFIMFPSVNNSGDRFSDCSVAQMQSTIGTASCIVDIVIDFPPLISSTPNLEGEVGAAYQYDGDNRVDVADAQNFILTLDIAPVGMTMDDFGNVSWIPNSSQVGTNSVQITASNAEGSDTQFFEVLVDEPDIPDPIDPVGFIDFSATSIDSYGGQDKTGGAALGDSVLELVLTGNTWKSIPFDYEVTPETILEFEFFSDVEAEIQGVSFDNDNSISANLAFNVFGRQNWGIQSYSYTDQGNYQKVIIPVGENFQGVFDRLVFILDNDANRSGAISIFRNVRVYEPGDDDGSDDGGDDGGDGGGDDGGDGDGEQPAFIDLSALNIEAHFNQDKEGTVSLTDGGFGIELTGNRWRRVVIDGQSITADSVLRFEFKSSAVGEIHGLGFLPSNSILGTRIFQVLGTQNWGIRDFTYDGSGEFQSFEIPIGQYFTDTEIELVFVMDHDRGDQNGVSHFRNISISE